MRWSCTRVVVDHGLSLLAASSGWAGFAPATEREAFTSPIRSPFSGSRCRANAFPRQPARRAASDACATQLPLSRLSKSTPLNRLRRTTRTRRTANASRFGLRAGNGALFVPAASNIVRNASVNGGHSVIYVALRLRDHREGRRPRHPPCRTSTGRLCRAQLMIGQRTQQRRCPFTNA